MVGENIDVRQLCIVKESKRKAFATMCCPCRQQAVSKSWSVNDVGRTEVMHQMCFGKKSSQTS